MLKASALSFLVAGFLWTGAPAHAQEAAPVFVDSGPDQGDFEHRAPDSVRITFDRPLGSGSSAQVYDECGGRIDDGVVEVSGEHMYAQLVARPRGRYLVTYSATGTEEGSGTAEGSFDFVVHFGAYCGPRPEGPGGDHDGHGGNGKPGHPNDHGNRDPDNGAHHREGAAGPHGSHDRTTGHVRHPRGGPGHGDHATPGSRHSDHGRQGAGHPGGHGGRGARHEHQGSRNHDRVGGGEEDRLGALEAPLGGGAVPPGGPEALVALALCATVGLCGGLVLRGLRES